MLTGGAHSTTCSLESISLQRSGARLTARAMHAAQRSCSVAQSAPRHDSGSRTKPTHIAAAACCVVIEAPRPPAVQRHLGIMVCMLCSVLARLHGPLPVCGCSLAALYHHHVLLPELHDHGAGLLRPSRPPPRPPLGATMAAGPPQADTRTERRSVIPCALGGRPPLCGCAGRVSRRRQRQRG